MTGSQSRLLDVGARVCWRDDESDLGTVTEKDWAGVTVKRDNRNQQTVLVFCLMLAVSPCSAVLISAMRGCCVL